MNLFVTNFCSQNGVNTNPFFELLLQILSLWFWQLQPLCPSSSVCVCVRVPVCVIVCLVAQSRLTLCDPMDCSPPGFSFYGIFPARILEWVANTSSRGFSQLRDWTHFSCVSCIGRWILNQSAIQPPWKPRLSNYSSIKIVYVKSKSLQPKTVRIRKRNYLTFKYIS